MADLFYWWCDSLLGWLQEYGDAHCDTYSVKFLWLSLLCEDSILILSILLQFPILFSRWWEIIFRCTIHDTTYLFQQMKKEGWHHNFNTITYVWNSRVSSCLDLLSEFENSKLMLNFRMGMQWTNTLILL